MTEYDKDIDFVKKAMEAELEGNIENFEDKKSKINGKILKAKRMQA